MRLASPRRRSLQFSARHENPGAQSRLRAAFSLADTLWSCTTQAAYRDHSESKPLCCFPFSPSPSFFYCFSFFSFLLFLLLLASSSSTLSLFSSSSSYFLLFFFLLFLLFAKSYLFLSFFFLLIFPLCPLFLFSSLFSPPYLPPPHLSCMSVHLSFFLFFFVLLLLLFLSCSSSNFYSCPFPYSTSHYFFLRLHLFLLPPTPQSPPLFPFSPCLSPHPPPPPPEVAVFYLHPPCQAA